MDTTPTPQLASPDDSPYETSSGPTTPATSPLFLPAVHSALDGKPLSHLLASVDMTKVVSRSINQAVIAQPGPVPAQVRNVCFIGAGYVGAPTAAVLALQNPRLKVNVLDRDQSRIRRWQSPHLPIHEPGLDEVVRAARDGAGFVAGPEDGAAPARSHHKPNLFFTTDSKSAISGADVIFLAVNTPTKAFGQGSGSATHMAAVDGAVKDIATYARTGAIIVEKSTVPCGTAERIQRTLRRLRPEAEFEILSNPEFLSEGCAVQNLFKPDRILIGSAKTPSGLAAATLLANLFSSWVPASKIVGVNAWSSELSKLVANAMLAQRISSINSISAICEETGADISEIAHSIGLDPRIGPKFLKAGLGFGGSCFRKDIASLTYLAESLGLDDVADYWRHVNEMNVHQRRRFVRRIIRRMDENLSGKKIALLGFAFKKDTGDTRESLAVDVVSHLLEERPAEISIYDPCCRKEDIQHELDISMAGRPQSAGTVTIYEDVYSACSNVDAVLIINESDQTPTDLLLPGGGSAPLPNALLEVTLPNTQRLRLREQLPCSSECTACRSKNTNSSTHPGRAAPVDWRRIADLVNEPKLVFDGRCILDVEAMEALGFVVESIGRKGKVDDV
ncbi:hypothetical protein DV737_g1110, partial [Chaetothyriales sp. CBS 132003]